MKSSSPIYIKLLHPCSTLRTMNQPAAGLHSIPKALIFWLLNQSILFFNIYIYILFVLLYIIICTSGDPAMSVSSLSIFFVISLRKATYKNTAIIVISCSIGTKKIKRESVTLPLQLLLTHIPLPTAPVFI